MNAHLATNIRNLRDAKHWTQQHLADAAGILHRTVQRVEAGQGASVDTLAALASAFDLTIDVLQFDYESLMSQLKKERDALAKTHDIVPVTPVTSSSDLDLGGGYHGYIFECAVKDDAVQDIFAALTSELQDVGELWDDGDAVQHRDWMKSAYERVEELRGLGVVVCKGSVNRAFRTAAGSIPVTVFCAVAWKTGDVRDAVAIPK